MTVSVIIGNITDKPALRKTNTGASVTQFTVADTRSWKNKNNEWEEKTSFIDVVAWADLADNIDESALYKGARVIVTGRLEQQSWEKNGEKRSKIVLVADEVGPSLKKAVVTGLEKSGQAKGYSKTQQASTQDSYFEDEAPF